MNETIEGYAPVVQQVSDFQVGELRGYSLNTTAFARTGDTGIDLSCNAQLRRRKVYAYINCDFTAAGICACSVVFYYNHSKVGSLPLAQGNGATVTNASSPSLFTAGTYSVQDSLQLYLINPVLNQVANNLLQPLYIWGKFDEAKVNVDFIQNVFDIRIWLGIISSQ
jgi:hypothetical protein